MSDHTHELGPSLFGYVSMCRTPGCTDLRIGTKRGGWRALTYDEQITVMAAMIEDTAIGQAFKIIHGPRYERVLQEKGYPRAQWSVIDRKKELAK